MLPILAPSTPGNQLWRFKTGNRILSSPAVSPSLDIIYFGSFDKYVYALNATSGKEIWKYPAQQAVVSSPVVSPDGQVR